MIEYALNTLVFSLAACGLALVLERLFQDPRDRQWLWRIAVMITALPSFAVALESFGLRLPIAPPLSLDGFDVGLTGQGDTTAGEVAPVAASPLLTSWQLPLGTSLLVLVAGTLIWRLSVAIRAATALSRALRLAAPSPADSDLRAEVIHAARAAGLNRPPHAVAIHTRHSAFVTGIWTGKVHVSQDALSVLTPAERHVILVHECTHIRRGDLIWRRVERAACDLFAWVPPVWFARTRLEALRELACDRDSIDRLGAPAPYARTLIKAARFLTCPAAAAAFNPKGISSMKTRILAMTGPNPRSKPRAIAGFAALSLLTAPLAVAQMTGDATSASSIYTAVVVADAHKISSQFGTRKDPFTEKIAMHKGVDIPAAMGTAITAPAAGVIGHVGSHDGYGNYVKLKVAEDTILIFAQLQEAKVAEGDVIEAGDLIGLMGMSGRATGPHLHFEVLVDGEYVDPTSVEGLMLFPEA
ncbi:MAG: M23/M56 family metallopeptidase [Hyphomonadaceae bacterium]|nr:M23/M56 family metallopeptidase [Hyphomonadaceae bacterium]